MLNFQNDGEIDVEHAFTFGMSSKIKSNAIGFFGTGLKYAVAITLRNKGHIEIWSGTKKYAFTTKTETTRDGRKHDVVYMNRRRQPFTTELGTKWEPWQAFRELYCNALDENSGACTDRGVTPEKGKTTITVRNFPAMEKAYAERRTFMLEGEPIYRGLNVECYEGASSGIYYRGILVGKLEEPSLYTYNLTCACDLTEDRTLKYPFVAKAHAATFMAACRSKRILEKVMQAEDRGTFESQINYDHAGLDPSDEFLETCSNLRKAGVRVSENVRNYHDKFRAEGGDLEGIEPTEDEKALIMRSCMILRRALGLEIMDKVPIVLVNSLGTGIYGKAARGTIYLSRRCLDSGQIVVTGTILEEFGHIKLDWRDESRDMQNCLINYVATLAHKYAETL